MKVVRHVQMNEWMGVNIVHLFSVFQDGLDCTHVMLNEVCLFVIVTGRKHLLL